MHVVPMRLKFPGPEVGGLLRQKAIFIMLAVSKDMRGRPNGVRLAPFRSGVRSLDLGDAHLVVRIPSLLAEALRREMLRVLFPVADGGFVREICDRYSKPAGALCGLNAEAAGLLEGKLEHRACHPVVTVVAFRALPREDRGVIGWLRRLRKTDGHLGRSLQSW